MSDRPPHGHHETHDAATRHAAGEAHDVADEARDTAAAAVAEARAGLAATAESLDKLTPLPDLLQRHYRLGVIAVAAAVLVGGMLLVLVVGLRNTQETVDLQTKTNEVAEVRGQVDEREGHHRLCVVALGASRPVEVAERICLPVLGDDYATLMAKLDRLERRLVKARNDG